jgi:hypothetical protein
MEGKGKGKDVLLYLLIQVIKANDGVHSWQQLQAMISSEKEQRSTRSTEEEMMRVRTHILKQE